MRGTFSLRSPVRPNPIGTHIVQLISVDGANLVVRGLDCLDGTPLIDLKPDRALFTPVAPRQAGRRPDRLKEPAQTVFDAKIRPLIDCPLDAAGRQLAAFGIGADQVTLAGFAIGIGAAIAIATGAFALGLVLISLNRLAAGRDDVVPRDRVDRRRGLSRSALDFVFYAAVPLAFAIHDPEANGLPAAFLIATFLANGTAFLAFAICAAKRNLTTTDRGAKSFFYIAGIAEGAETIAVFCAFCLWPAGFPWLASGFAVVCAVSATARILAAWRMLR